MCIPAQKNYTEELTYFAYVFLLFVPSDSQGHKESGESPKEEKCGEESLEDQELGEGEGDDEGSGPNTDFQEPPDSAKDVRTVTEV